MSPAKMYSFAWATIASCASRVRFELSTSPRVLMSSRLTRPAGRGTLCVSKRATKVFSSWQARS